MIKIDILQVSKIHMKAKLESGFSIPMDGAQEIGGENNGARPMELFLSALAGCSGIDVLLIMQKAKSQVDSFHIQINANRREEIPKVFTDINLNFIIKASKISEKQLARAISLSVDKYCSVRAMIKDEVKITYALEYTRV